MKLKRLTACLAAAALAMSLLTACKSDSPAPRRQSGDTLRIVTTIFPIYDWVRELLGDNRENIELVYLLGSGIDLHSYQQTVDDMVSISTCDMFIYIGGSSDLWVEDALRAADNPDIVAISLLDSLGDAVKEEAFVEGMEKDDDEEDTELDEHVWLSLRHAETLCELISQQLGLLDPQNAAVYAENSASYCEKLQSLDDRFTAVVESASKNVLLFCDRFPFRYLADDYGLDYYAAFAGCSSETEASFETVIFLAERLNENSLDCVVVTETSDKSIANTVIQSSGDASRAILTLDSIQSVLETDVASGYTYLSAMERNLETLKNALA